MSVTDIAGGIVMVDVIDELPQHRFRRYQRRTKKIRQLLFHKSGILGASGFAGCFNSARYCVTKRKVGKSTVLGWAGGPYTFWYPFELYTVNDADDDDLIDHEDEPSLYGDESVLFRCQPDNLVTWHTGGIANHYGISGCFQGNSTKYGLSASQIELAEGHIPWCAAFYRLPWPRGLSWHSDRGPYGPPKIKPVCPGRGAVDWLTDYRGS